MIHLFLAVLLTQTYRSLPHDDLMNYELRLDRDGTYTLSNESSSCWFFFVEEGTWSEARGTLTLRSIPAQFATVELKSQSGNRAPAVKVTVIDAKGRPLPDVEVSVTDGANPVKTNRDGIAVLGRRPSHSAMQGGYVFIDLLGTGWTANSVTGSGAYGEFLLVVHSPTPIGHVEETRFRRHGKDLISSKYGGMVFVPQ